MSTPEQPLTRKQLREIERTGAVPVQTAPSPDDDAASASASVAPLPRAAEPAAPQPSPIPDANVDLGAAPLTRRQARQQERIRTASVPVITPDVAASHVAVVPEVIEGVPQADQLVSDDVPDDETSEIRAENDSAEALLEQVSDDDVDEAEAAVEVVDDDVVLVEVEDAAVEDASDDDAQDADDAQATDDVEVPSVESDAEPAWHEPASYDSPSDEATPADDDTATEHEPATADARDDAQWSEGAVIAADEPADTGDLAEDADPVDDQESVEEFAPVSVGPQFGAALLAGEPEIAAVDLPPSFDELIARNASSATSSTPSALILSQSPTAPSLAGPITATGEVIITGSYRLPDGLGSSGVDPRSADGKDVDAVLIDGELPAASSPTPIAASAAISTVRGADEIIRPPAPEKGSKLILSLAITAGVLAVAVIAVLVVALTNGVFS